MNQKDKMYLLDKCIIHLTKAINGIYYNAKNEDIAINYIKGKAIKEIIEEKINDIQITKFYKKYQYIVELTNKLDGIY